MSASLWFLRGSCQEPAGIKVGVTTHVLYFSSFVHKLVQTTARPTTGQQTVDTWTIELVHAHPVSPTSPLVNVGFSLLVGHSSNVYWHGSSQCPHSRCHLPAASGSGTQPQSASPGPFREQTLGFSKGFPSSQALNLEMMMMMIVVAERQLAILDI